MDEKTTEGHSRWCTSCLSWCTESELQVPADGKPRHKACGTITTPRPSHDRWCPDCGIWVPAAGQYKHRDDRLWRHARCNAVTTPTKTTPGEHVALATNGDGKQARRCTCTIGEDHFAEKPQPSVAVEKLRAVPLELVDEERVIEGSPTPRISEELYQQLRQGLEAAERGMLPEPVRSRAVEEQALAGDLEDLLPQLREVAGVLSYRANWLAKMLVDRGWVLAARGRVEVAESPVPSLELHPVLVAPGGVTTPCCCQADCCLGEGNPPNNCEYCASIDGELPCPIADAEAHRG